MSQQNLYSSSQFSRATIFDDEVRSKRTALDLDRPSLASITSSQESGHSSSSFRLKIKNGISKLKLFYWTSRLNQKQKRNTVNLLVLTSDKKSRRSYNTVSSSNGSDEESSSTLKSTCPITLKVPELGIRSMKEEAKLEEKRKLKALQHLERAREKLRINYQVDVKNLSINCNCETENQEPLWQTELRKHRWISFLEEKDLEVSGLKSRQDQLWDIPEKVPRVHFE